MLTPGTISLTKHSATITGVGTNFTMTDDDSQDIEGQFIKVIGHNDWFLIKTVTSDTVIVLDRAFRGETVAGAYYELGGDMQFQKPEIIVKESTDAGKFNMP